MHDLDPDRLEVFVSFVMRDLRDHTVAAGSDGREVHP